MKIAFFSFYNGELERGAENWVDQIATLLSKNHQVVVFQSREVKSKKNYLIKIIKSNVHWDKKPERISIWRKLFLDYWSIVIARFTIKTLSAIKNEKFDIVLGINGGWQTILLRMASWIYGSKFIIVSHSGRGWDDAFNLWCFPDVFVALTKVSLKWAKKINPLVKIVHIPNGVDLKLFSKGVSNVRIPLKDSIVLCVGALSSSKRIDLVIKAMEFVSGVNLLVVGEGEMKEELQKLGDEKLGERFYLTSFSYKEMPDIYRAAKAFVLVSWEHESFPLVYLEAMASNLPIVATNDAARREIIGEAGVFVDPSDPQLLSQTIKDTLRRNWVDKPRRQAELYSWENVAGLYEKLFAETIK